jgi:hypothetical protein
VRLEAGHQGADAVFGLSIGCERDHRAPSVSWRSLGLRSAPTHRRHTTINNGDSSGPIFDEGQNRYPNVAETRIHVPDPRKKVTFDSSSLIMDK